MSELRLENISHAYGTTVVVRDVSLSVAAGEVVCLLGPSGCGKTTLLRISAGLEEVQQGRVYTGERLVADAARGLQAPPEKRGIGLMFQDFALFPHLTIEENVAFGLSRRDPERLAWARRALEHMGMQRFAAGYPHTLSGGQQQRVALLRALATQPRVLLLDEPFSDLDVTRRAAVREQVLGLLKETGVATLMVTHDPEEAMFMADRILVMRHGAIVQSGTPVDTYLHPADAFVAGLFGPVNRLDGRVADGAVETPLGRFAAPGLADGTAAMVLIRPEGIILAPTRPDDAATPTARVLSARLLGRSSHLRLACRALGEAELEVRAPGIFLPATGECLGLGIDPRHAFVFAAESTRQ